MEVERIIEHLRNRPAQLIEARENGTRIIGYFPGNYVPEEIIYAAGAAPVCLAHGVSSGADVTALTVVPNIICPFARAQIGERILKINPYYTMIDLLVAPITCQHIKKAAEIIEYFGDIEIFKLGIPHQYDADFEVEYYVNRLKDLKDTVQKITGNEVTNEKLDEAIGLYNKIRELLRKISLLRSSSQQRITAKDFFRLNQATLYADPLFMVDLLGSVYQELKEHEVTDSTDSPRLMLIGPNIAYDDYKVLELVESSGGNIVIEEICEGMKYYWHTIEQGDDPFQSLARGYLVDRVPAAFLRASSRKRLDFALELISEFKVTAVIWYELLNCETYDSESYYFEREMSQRDIPVLILGAGYGQADSEQLKIRTSAFIEMVKGI